MYSEKLVQLPNIGCHYLPLAIRPAEPDLEKLGLGGNYPRLLCPGSLFKYAPENDCVLVEIAKRLGKCQLIFFSQKKSFQLILQARLREAFKEAGLNLDDFVIFIPWLNLNEFHGLMKNCDVFLDSIGFSGFNTAMQAVDCGLPIVARNGRFMRGRLASGIIRRLGIPELIANSNEEYIELVVRLAGDKGYQKAVSKKIIERRYALYEDIEPILALQNFLLENCRKLVT